MQGLLKMFSICLAKVQIPKSGPLIFNMIGGLLFLCPCKMQGHLHNEEHGRNKA